MKQLVVHISLDMPSTDGFFATDFVNVSRFKCVVFYMFTPL